MGGGHYGGDGTYPSDPFRSSGRYAWLFRECFRHGLFVLLYIWMVTVLGLTTLRAGFPFRWKKLAFLLNHAGLFIALITATLGNADMQRLKMTTRIDNAEWRAMDEHGKLIELPLAIELKDFTIDEYPPKLMLIDNETGRTLPEKKAPNICCWKKV